MRYFNVDPDLALRIAQLGFLVGAIITWRILFLR